MARLLSALLLFLAGSLATPVHQKPLGIHDVYNGDESNLPTQSHSKEPRKIQGRFLHITDIHPDPFYKAHTDSDDACHYGKGSAGFYGAEDTSCDTPLTLVNATFKWIEDNLKDKIDFVVWTGDSARHDSDERKPREEYEVVQLNKFVVEKFVEVFGKPDNIGDDDPTNDFVVPIVPTYGNNDILPHNIFKPGSNRWTKRYLQIWEKFIPEAQRHTFDRGGWFFVEVIPDKLVVFSLNTLYFFDSNAAVDGCKKKSQPGYEHMEWLRIQLQLLRDRGMKAIMMGHVPPARTESKQSWDETCWQKYTLWMKQYRDVVVGGAYGHMNIDHFMLQDSDELKKYYTKGKIERQDAEPWITANRPADEEPMFGVQAGANYLLSLREAWSGLPKLPDLQNRQEIGSTKNKKKSKKDKQKDSLDAIGGEWAERFSLSLVSPSVVPNYFPTLRVIDYNISSLEDAVVGPGLSEPRDFYFASCEDLDQASNDETTMQHESNTSRKKHKKKKHKKKAPKFKVPKAPSKSSPPGPAYSPQPLTWLSYTQYFANLTHINNESKGAKSKPRDFKYEVEYDTKTDEGYKLNDLTVRSYLDLALRIGQKRKAEKSDIENFGDGEEQRHAIAEAEKEDVNSEDDGNDSNELNSLKHKKKQHKKHKHKKKKSHKINQLWATFVQRAFVGTKTEDEIEASFG